nr:unnamed protein product [Spirometra erinaceieuropaei]
MGLPGHMRIQDSEIHRSIDTPLTPTMTSPVSTPWSSVATASSPISATTTIITAETDSDSPNLSCQHCPCAFTSHIGVVCHLRIHLTENANPVPGTSTYIRRICLNYAHWPRTFSYLMGLLVHMRIHGDLRYTTAGYTIPSHLLPPAPAPHISITRPYTTPALD